MTDNKLRPTQADILAADTAFDIAFRGDTETIDRDMAELFAAHRIAATDTQVSSLVSAGAALAEAEADYRWKHDALGGGDIETGRAWDKMRRCSEAMRAALGGMGSKSGA